MLRRILVGVLFFVAYRAPTADAELQYSSHHPTRPLPKASSRPLPETPCYYVDAERGDDRWDGSPKKPWKSLAHGASQLKPSDTLVLHGGVYFEHATIAAKGALDRRITIRSYPNEIAIIDGGYPEFELSPQTAWEPVPDGAPGEYRSTKSYPVTMARADTTNLLGNFVDSMTPLHGYRFLGDLRSDNPYWNVDNKVGDESFVSCGPGLWLDAETGRFHVRLTHTLLSGLGDDNYRGETDPQRMALIVADGERGSPLRMERAEFVCLQDLVLRGSRDATLDLFECHDIELDGLTVYGGSTPIRVVDTVNFRMIHTACRGLATPWTFRGSLKYRAIESRLFSASGWDPTGNDNRNFEIANCEFTDSVDGVFIGGVNKVRFHHNYLDNVSDDGIFLTAGTACDGTTYGGDIHITQSLLSRCLTTFAFGVGHGRQRVIENGRQTGAGVVIACNVFDFRRPVMYYWPTGPDAPQEISSLGRFAGDHGGPVWEPMRIYHNTILAGDPPRYDYLTDGLGRASKHGTTRRVFNNIVWQKIGMPGQTLPDPADDFQADHNLIWSATDGPGFTGELFQKFRKSPAYAESRRAYSPGWTTNDRFVDPKFASADSDWREEINLMLEPDSPAIDMGMELPNEWPAPLRANDKRRPDVGAIPAGSEPWGVGQFSRIDVFGRELDLRSRDWSDWELPREEIPPRRLSPRILIWQGYPAFDAPLVEFEFRRHRLPIDVVERQWVPSTEWKKYDVIAIDGSFTRAGTKPDRFSADDLTALREFLETGGTLLLMRERFDLFASEHGKAFLADVLGTAPREPMPALKLLRPTESALSHLDADWANAWLGGKGFSPVLAVKGENWIGSEAGSSILLRVPVGQGQIFYVGWSPMASIPHGRQPGTVAEEEHFLTQERIVGKVVDGIVGQKQ